MPDHRLGRSALLRAATTPRMIGLLALFLAAAAVCGLLGAWQLDRAQVRGQSKAAVEQAAADADPPAVTEVLEPQTTFTGSLVGRSVTVEGTYEAEGQLLVVGRSVAGQPGSLVLTPLRVDGADGSPVLPVVRGWVPAEVTSAQDPRIAPPTGPVDLGGFLQGGEAAAAEGLPAGQVAAISPAALLHQWDGPIYTGYLVLHTSTPTDASVADGTLTLLPRPVDPQAGLNVQNLAYALQWWIFGGFAVVLWLRLVRDEARAASIDDVEQATVPAAPAPPTPAAGETGTRTTPSQTKAHPGGDP